MGDEALTELDGVAGGQMGPLGTNKARELGIIFEVDAGNSGSL
jgi:hypothetical protein